LIINILGLMISI